MKQINGLVLALCVFYGLSAHGAMTGRQIMEKQKELHKTSSEYEVQQMVLIDKTGTKEARSLKRYVKEVEKDVYRSLIVFLSPSDIKGTSLLNWQHKNAEDDQWLYLPANGKLQRIAKGSKRNYFMGTDFTYEDMQSEEFDDYQYNTLKEESCGEGQSCYVVEAVPANATKKRESGYSKRVMWVDKTSFVTVKAEFYDRRKKLLKTQSNSDFKNVSGNIWRGNKSLMENHQNGHKTAIKIVERKFNHDIPDKNFTERFILKGEHIQ